jgi:hypothetical protein
MGVHAVLATLVATNTQQPAASMQAANQLHRKGGVDNELTAPDWTAH